MSGQGEEEAQALAWLLPLLPLLPLLLPLLREWKHRFWPGSAPSATAAATAAPAKLNKREPESEAALLAAAPLGWRPPPAHSAHGFICSPSRGRLVLLCKNRKRSWQHENAHVQRDTSKKNTLNKSAATLEMLFIRALKPTVSIILKSSVCFSHIYFRIKKGILFMSGKGITWLLDYYLMLFLKIFPS